MPEDNDLFLDWIKFIAGTVLFFYGLYIFIIAMSYIFRIFTCGCIDFILDEPVENLIGIVLVLGFYELSSPFLTFSSGVRREKKTSQARTLITALEETGEISRYEALKLLDMDEDDMEFSRIFMTKEFQEIKYNIDLKSGHIMQGDPNPDLIQYKNLRYCPECGGDRADSEVYSNKLDQILEENLEKPEREQKSLEEIEKSLQLKEHGNILTQRCMFCDTILKFCRVCRTLVQKNQVYCGRCNNKIYPN